MNSAFFATNLFVYLDLAVFWVLSYQSNFPLPLLPGADYFLFLFSGLQYDRV